MKWTTEQILALAPDAASNKAAQKLVKTSQWSKLAYDKVVIWGECQGSGNKPYQTRIAVDEPAFKCSCPSRKFPCKHALALFLLFVQQNDAFTREEPPPWVTEWLEKRAQHQAKRIEKANKPVDSVAKTKRVEKREEKIRVGLEELSLWLRDLVHHGFAELPSKPNNFFEGMAARMVDAQAPGLAHRVRELFNKANGGGQDWASQVLEAVARLHLLIESYRRLESLSPELQNDIRILVGWSPNKDDILQQAAIRDFWLVLGQYLETDEIGQLLVQRIWLQGAKTHKMALLINFIHPTMRTSVDYGWLTGTQVEAELCFYSSAVPLRAIAKTRYEATPMTTPKGAATLQAAFATYKEAICQQPWIDRFPMILDNMNLTQQLDETWSLTDTAVQSIPIMSRFDKLWDLLAVSGGHPISVFGEWQHTGFYPLGVWNEKNYLDLAPPPPT